MLSVIVAYAYGYLHLRDIDWLLTHPAPQNFFAFKGLVAAPPNGLFLADVVYDPDTFLNPKSPCMHPWDYHTNESET